MYDFNDSVVPKNYKNLDNDTQYLTRIRDIREYSRIEIDKLMRYNKL